MNPRWKSLIIGKKNIGVNTPFPLEIHTHYTVYYCNNFPRTCVFQFGFVFAISFGLSFAELYLITFGKLLIICIYIYPSEDRSTVFLAPKGITHRQS